VSVVVATYNRPALLSALLDDLRRQELLPGEVVVVDDGSEQPAAAVLADGKFPFVLTVLRQENSGAAAARHRGILAASGEIIVIVDDDMCLDLSFLRAHARAHEEGAAVVMGQICSAEKLGEMPVFEKFHARQLVSWAEAVRAGRARVNGARLCTGNVSFRRADYLAVGGFDLALRRSEDRELGIRFERRGLRLAYAEAARSVHRSDHDSLEGWMRHAFLYGVYDRKIAQKHPDLPAVDPWAFLALVNPVSRPLLLGAALMPSAGAVLSTLAIRAAIALDRVGLTRLAIAGTTLTYGLEYFRGMAKEIGSRRDVVRSLRRHRARMREAVQ
jgi:GT2 family glycosyltransferase